MKDATYSAQRYAHTLPAVAAAGGKNSRGSLTRDLKALPRDLDAQGGCASKEKLAPKMRGTEMPR